MPKTPKEIETIAEDAMHAAFALIAERIDPDCKHDLGGYFAYVCETESDRVTELAAIAARMADAAIAAHTLKPVSKYVAALRVALAFVKDQRNALETEEGRDNHDGVVIAAELMGHAAAINEAYAADHGPFQSPGDRITGEAGYLAGYWYTVALLQAEGDWLKTEKAWFDHAASILTDEIGSNTLPR